MAILVWEEFNFYCEDAKPHTQQSSVDQQSTVAVIIGML